ncbi:MAG: SufD family Fe-S cluster assembly protein [Sulfurovum sp.]|nr:SufD family Fe-S cluster assembly protein [Sulfurovum sp.]MCB4783781.1 SufD family Fe-S cluster assembly protein [Sulfurovum sp.]
MKLSELKKKSPSEIAQLLSVDRKSVALERFAILGLPNKKNEEYRYFQLKKLFEKEYRTISYIPKPIKEAKKIIIVDGIVTHAPHGMRIYYEQCQTIDMEHFDPMYYLGHLLSPHVIKIDLDGDTDVEVEHHYSQSGALIAYRIVLINQANRHATLFESFYNKNIKDTLVLYGYDTFIAPDSTLRILKNQKIHGEDYAMIASHHLQLNRHANAVVKSFDMGSGMGLQLIKVDLDYYAHLNMGHLLYINDGAQRGTISKIIHQGKYATSHQEAKSIIDSASCGIFDALIRVEHSAKWTKAYQNSKAILLHEKAYMASKPQLEIYIDELEASHGSTTGQLDEKQLFYLRSRGIDEIEAKKILVIAFANTLIEQIKDSRHQEVIKATFEEAFYAGEKDFI